MKTLEDVQELVLGCKKCNCGTTCANKVFSDGNPKSNIMFVGECPGDDEDDTGLPFQGKCGQVINKFIDSLGLKRQDVYICNTIKCRPTKPMNNPTEVEVENCKEFLFEQIQLVNPKIIVCWGAWAAQTILESTAPIGQLRGRVEDFDGTKVLATYHPSYLLRSPSSIKHIWNDMKLVLDLIDELDYIIKVDDVPDPF